jgi:hypothetical protein
MPFRILKWVFFIRGRLLLAMNDWRVWILPSVFSVEQASLKGQCFLFIVSLLPLRMR